jgi:heptosyltransferase-1
MKSALVGRLARGRLAGYDRRGAREPLAASLYNETLAVSTAGRHAVDRTRDLFAAALHYELPGAMDYGLPPKGRNPGNATGAYLVFIPGTTWTSKQWPVSYWRTLLQLASDAGWPVRLVAGNAAEREAAGRISAGIDDARVESSLSLDGLARLLRDARAAVSVDSGPGHLAAAVGTPGVSIYGATDPDLTGTRGAGQVHLRVDYTCAPCLRRHCLFADTGQIHPDCYATVPPVTVWSTLHDLIQTR